MMKKRNKTPSAPLRWRLLAAAVVVVAILMAVAPTQALGAKSASVTVLRSRLADLRAQAKKAGDAYSKAYWRLDSTKSALSKTNKKLAASENALAAASARLATHAAAMYRQGEIDYLALLLTSDTLDDLLVRLEYMTRVGLEEADTIREIEDLRRDLMEQRAELKELETQREREAAALKKRAAALDSKLRSIQAEYEKVQAQLAAAVARASGSRYTSRAPAGPNGMVFPVQGPNYYSNTWGAARSGGRTHKGTDIMARSGTPCVATLSGTVRARSSSLGGLTIWLRADSGWTFYYAHLSRYAVTSGRVQAGEVIGYVGSTGNASASAPHLHFEIHPDGGAAVNPYPYLRQME